MELEEIVRAYKEIARQIEDLEKQKKALSLQILQSIPKNTMSIYVDDYIVKRYSQIYVKTSLQDAKAVGASKVQEVVDKDKIKQLHREGLLIPDVLEVQYVRVVRDPAKLEPVLAPESLGNEIPF